MNQTIEFGLGRRVITPHDPVSLAGYFNIRMVTEVFDDIEVRALVLRSAGRKFLLLQFDLITVSEALYRAVREGMSQWPDFDDSNILMTATHTHTGPDYRESCQVRCPAYFRYLTEQALAAIADANASFRSGELACGLTSDDRFQFNRRYWMKNGSVLTNPGKCNPDIVRPEGVTDPEIPLLAIRNEEGIQVLFANIVNHTDTIGGTEVSADWAGFTRRTLEKSFAPGAMMFPLIGASGNINHFDVSNRKNQGAYAEAERIGCGYAETIAAALPSLQALKEFEFKTFFSLLEVNPPEVSEEQIAEARATVEKYKDAPDPARSGITITSEDLVRGEPIALKYFACQLLNAAQDRTMKCFRLTGFSFGPVLFASLPSEPFVEIGLSIRKAVFADKLCFIVSHGNGTGSMSNHGGYIPNVWNYGRGGYETEVLSNPFERHTSEKLIEAWGKMR